MNKNWLPTLILSGIVLSLILILVIASKQGDTTDTLKENTIDVSNIEDRTKRALNEIASAERKAKTALKAAGNIKDYLQGEKGLSGVAGENGIIGEPGPPGLVGETGPMGLPGLQGLLGPIGLQGFMGQDGAPGEPGSNGSQGIPGDTGSQGNQGGQGESGPQGDQGNQGATGPQGPQGDPGSPGAPCPNQQIITTIADGPVTVCVP